MPRWSRISIASRVESWRSRGGKPLISSLSSRSYGDSYFFCIISHAGQTDVFVAGGGGSMCVFLTPRRAVMGQTTLGSVYTGDVRSTLCYVDACRAFAPA